MRASLKELRDEMTSLMNEAGSIEAETQAQNRDFTPQETTRIEQILAKHKSLKVQYDLECERQGVSSASGRLADGVDPSNISGNFGAVPARQITSSERGPYAGPHGLGEMARDAYHAARPGGNPSQRLIQIQNAPTTFSSEGVGGDGGWAVPPDFQTEIWQKVSGEESLIPLSDSYSTPRNTMTWPVDEDTPWSTTGGIQAYFESEAAQLQQSKIALQSREIKLNKLTCLIPVTSELLEDAPSLDSYLRKKVPEKMDFKIKLKMLSGVGVGEPLGILNAPSLVTVSKVANQAGGTVVSQNIEAMWSAMYAPCRRRGIWLINQDVEPQLSQLYIPIPNRANTENVSGFPLYYPAGSIAGTPYATLKGRPVIETQACSMLGSPGDIIFVDLKQYLTAVKAGGPRVETSAHLFFDYDLFCYRFIIRFAGQPWWMSTIQSLNDASNPLGWAAVLAQRS
jgi:HK97 family phage major capsid protein